MSLRQHHAPHLSGLVATAVACLVLTAVAPATAAGPDGAGGGGSAVEPGAVVTGELVRAYAEVGQVHDERDHDAGAEALEDGDRPGLITWISTDSGADVTVHTEDLADVALGSRVQVRLGRFTPPAQGDPESQENSGYEVLAATTLSEPDPEPTGATVGAPAVAAASTPHQVTIAMVAPAGQDPDSATVGAFETAVEGPVSTFWSEQTGGALTFEVEKRANWFRTTATCENYNGLWAEVATKVGFTAGAGKHLLYVTTKDGTSRNCYSGLAQIGSGIGSGGLAYVRGLGTSLIAHELGHNVSLEHSDGLLCDGVPDGGAYEGCERLPYRDWYDVMGVSWQQLGSLNTAQSTHLGVMPVGSVVTAVSTPSRVTLAPVSTRAGTTPRSLRIEDDGTVYTVEFRPAVGRDSWLTGDLRGLDAGVLVRREMESTTTENHRSVLLDASPSETADENDWAQTIPVGGTLRLASGDHTIKVEALVNGSAELAVAVDGVWPVVTVPAAPTAVTAVRGNRAAAVSWTAAQSNGSTVTGYTVTSSPGSRTCATTGALTCDVSGLTNGTAYTFTVVAKNATGTGPASAPSDQVTPAGVPGAPYAVSATAGAGAAAVSWTAATANGSPVTGYTVTSAPGSKTCATTGAVTCTVSGLTNGTAYTFTVKATNAVGTGPASGASAAVTPASVPGASGTPTAVRGDQRATVSWGAAAANGSAITGYTVTSTPGSRTCTTATTSCAVTGLTNGISYTFTVTATNAIGSGPASPMSNPTRPSALTGPEGSRFVPLSPTRVVDTRYGVGAPAGPVGAGSAVTVKVTGVAGVPASGVTAVVLNVTSVSATASSFVTVYPAGQDRPAASNLNLAAGVTRPNLVVVRVGTNGELKMYNAVGSTHLLADIAGYYTTGDGSEYVPLSPTRVVDTRYGVGAPAGPVGAGSTVTVKVTDVAGVPASGVTAVVLNVTSVSATASSFVTVYPAGQDRPAASNLNLAAGVTRPNLVVVRVGTNGELKMYNAVGSTHLLADIAGYYTTGDGSEYVPLSPTRVVDTRYGVGAPAGPVGADSTVTVKVTDVAGVPATGVTAVVLNVTSVSATASSFVTVYPAGQDRPAASNLNLAAGVTLPNLVVVRVGTNGELKLYNAVGSTHLLGDIAGYYTG